jgi:hypothetical protein
MNCYEQLLDSFSSSNTNSASGSASWPSRRNRAGVRSPGHCHRPRHYPRSPADGYAHGVPGSLHQASKTGPPFEPLNAVGRCAPSGSAIARIGIGGSEQLLGRGDPGQVTRDRNPPAARFSARRQWEDTDGHCATTMTSCRRLADPWSLSMRRSAQGEIVQCLRPRRRRAARSSGDLRSVFDVACTCTSR